ncbi:MAG: glycosyltransferase, partial [Mycobacterium sp.]|nr:glycosyltransferase [Mycobacterium sp.]
MAALAADPDAVEVRPRTSNPQELRGVIRSATVVVMPSQAEGFGLVATEAIEQGVPVLMASSSGAGQFLADLPGYGVLARHFNLVRQDFGAPASPEAWSARLNVVLGNLPAAWENARLLQELLVPFTRRRSAEYLVDAALKAEEAPARRASNPPLRGGPTRTRVRVVDGLLVVYPHGDEVGDHDLIQAIADAMETDSEVRDAVFNDNRGVLIRQPRPLDDFYVQAIEAVFGRRGLSAFVTEPIPAALVSAALRGESDARLQLDAMVKPGIQAVMCQMVDESVADVLVHAVVEHAVLPREVDQGQDELSAVLAAYRDSAREELQNHLVTRPDVLDSGSVDELGGWLLRKWDVGLSGFDGASPAATRHLLWALDHMLRTHPEVVVRKGIAITVGEVADGNAVEMRAGRDGNGRMAIESITVDHRRLFGAISAPQLIGAMTIGAFGAAVLDAGGIGHAVYRYLLQYFTGPQLEVAEGVEEAFESVVRGQLGERAMPAVTVGDRFRRRSAPSQRFDVDQAARAAVYQVEMLGWYNASDLARALYQLLFAQVQSVRANEVGQFGRSGRQPVASENARSRGRLGRVVRRILFGGLGGEGGAGNEVAERLADTSGPVA